MKLEIIPSKDSMFDCLLGLVVSVSKYKRWDYKMMFLYRWGFEYYQEKVNYEFIGERISCGWFGYWDALKKYHGIKVNWFLGRSDKKTSEKIRSQLLKDRPVILNINAFWCPWSKSYKKHYTDHYCLAIGIDDVTKKIICIDPYVSAQTENLYYADLIHVERCGILIVDIDDIQQWTIKEVLKEIKNHTYDIPNGRDMFDSMLLFADELENKELLKREFLHFKDVHAIPIIIEISRISFFRKAFAETLDYIAYKAGCEKLENISENIKKISHKWDIIKMLFIKMAMKNIEGTDINTEQIAKRVRNVSSYERDIYIDLCKLIMDL